MKLYRDEAIVLRTHDLGEADRIVTLMTRNHGKIRAVAKGVRRTKSRFGGRLEPFAMVDVQLHVGRTLDIVTEVATLNPYGLTIGRHYDLYTAASAIAEIADKITLDEAESDPQQYLLLLGALHALATNAHRPALIVDSYMLRAMALSGWALSLYECAVCSRTDDLEAFHVQAGGMVCSGCAPKASAHPSELVVELLGALVSGNWEIADHASPESIRVASSLATAYLQWHVERTIRSLRLMESA